MYDFLAATAFREVMPGVGFAFCIAALDFTYEICVIWIWDEKKKLFHSWCHYSRSLFASLPWLLRYKLYLSIMNNLRPRGPFLCILSLFYSTLKS